MVVWEYRNYATQWERTGKRPEARPHLRHFIDCERFLQYGSRTEIERIAKQQESISDDFAGALSRLVKLNL